MKDCMSQQDMMALIGENAPADQLTVWRRHLRICDKCATHVAGLRAEREPAIQKIEKSNIQTDKSIDRQLISGLEPNLTLGDFLLERRLGTGGMGVVYQALQVSL